MTKWAIPKGYNNKKVDWAGDILIDKNSSTEDIILASEIMDNWRQIHSYPMHVFSMRIKTNLPKLDKDGFRVQRLKRIPAIIHKLERSKRGTLRKLKLSQLQDLGGCRAVLSDVNKTIEFCQKIFLKSELKHERITEKDFISKPRESGYRGIHLVYKYYSDKGKKIYNGLLIEIQIRSRLQHLWATAVETAGFFTGQAIKSSEASEEWLEFFKLVSSAFALMENCPCIPNTPPNKEELYEKIKQKEESLNIIKIMDGWRRAIKVINEGTKNKQNKKFKYYVLQLNINEEILNIYSFTDQEEEKAMEKYILLEKELQGKNGIDVVLVGADTPVDLEKGYPNYFVDSLDFLNILQTIIK
jgi:hypothetical protein